jgi:hypothetical protein
MTKRRWRETPAYAAKKTSLTLDEVLRRLVVLRGQIPKALNSVEYSFTNAASFG